MDRCAPTERTNSADSARAEVEALRAALVAAEAKVSDAQVQIAALELMIEKLRRALYGRRSERKERLLGQLELELDELTARAAEDDLTTETATERTTGVKAFERRRPSRKPFPEHLPRERGGGAFAQLVHVLRVEAAVEGGRGRDRDAGGDSAPVESDSDGA